MIMIMIMTMVVVMKCQKMGSQKNSYDSYGSGRVSIGNNIGAFYSFSGTYFFSISGEKLNKPSDVQVVLMPHHPL